MKGLKNVKPKELIDDYFLFDEMTRVLAKRRANLLAFGKKVVTKLKKNDLKRGLVDDIEEVVHHVEVAQRELDKAKRKLKVI